MYLRSIKACYRARSRAKVDTKVKTLLYEARKYRRSSMASY